MTINVEIMLLVITMQCKPAKLVTLDSLNSCINIGYLIYLVADHIATHYSTMASVIKIYLQKATQPVNAISMGSQTDTVG